MESIFEKSKNPYGNIAHVIAVMSGKGGVGKSSVSALVASSLTQRGLKVGILDADITGPSIPKIFGVHGPIQTEENAMLPVKSQNGTQIISSNLLLEHEDDPVIWRGPMIGGMIKQFFEEVRWGDLDCLVVDLPPGTGDVPLTVMQTLPLDGLIVVTSPQELVTMIVKKAIHMADRMRVPIYGLIENMSYFECPCCGTKTDIYGESKAAAVADSSGIPLLGRLPIRPDVARLSDAGKIEEIPTTMPEFFSEITDNLMVRLGKMPAPPQ